MVDRMSSMTPDRRHPATRRDSKSLFEPNGLRVVVATLAVMCSTVAGANKPPNITAAEMAMIPPYCKDANTFGYGGEASGNMSPNAPKWVAMMGKGFWAIHHYCWAQINLMRIQRRSVPPVIRHGEQVEALGDLGYVIENSPPDFVLLPEIYTKMGQVQLDLKRASDANASFAKARSLKPDYWPAYFHWAWYLQSVGQKATAKQLVEEGLSYAPASKSLQRLLTDLGGDPRTIKRKIPSGGSAPDPTSAEPTTPSASVNEPPATTQ